jgi:hypothetical protein
VATPAANTTNGMFSYTPLNPRKYVLLEMASVESMVTQRSFLPTKNNKMLHEETRMMALLRVYGGLY